MTKKDTNEENTEGKEEDLVEDGHRQTEFEKKVIRAFRTLLHGCEEQWCYSTYQDSASSESEAEEVQSQLISSWNGKDSNSSSDAEWVISELESCGYHARWWKFGAEDFGSRAARVRVYFVAWSLPRLGKPPTSSLRAKLTHKL